MGAARAAGQGPGSRSARLEPAAAARRRGL